MEVKSLPPPRLRCIEHRRTRALSFDLGWAVCGDPHGPLTENWQNSDLLHLFLTLKGRSARIQMGDEYRQLRQPQAAAWQGDLKCMPCDIRCHQKWHAKPRTHLPRNGSSPSSSVSSDASAMRVALLAQQSQGNLTAVGPPRHRCPRVATRCIRRSNDQNL